MKAKNEEAKFKYRDFKLDDLGTEVPDENILANYSNFLRSDHVRFWYSNHVDYYVSFKAVMLSDTGNHSHPIMVRTKDRKQKLRRVEACFTAHVLTLQIKSCTGNLL